ncbi:MAG: hypothetical protein R2786_06970 [Flavobacteriaceae bacterium]
MNLKSQLLKVKDLILWDENARFPDKYYNSDEKEMINYFLSKPKFELKKFIEEIVKDFDLPQLEKLVVWNNDNNLIVIEGNRRLSAYKLLINPNLSDNVKLKDSISLLKKSIDINENFELECIVGLNESECLRYVDRKHIKKNNEVSWEDGERTNYDVRRGNKNENNLVKIGIIKKVRELEIPEKMKDKVLGKGFVTNFFRTITTTPAKKKYGYRIIENGELLINYRDFDKELKVIIYNLLNKEDFQGNKIDSRTLNKKESIEKYIESIKPLDSQKVDKEIQNNTTEDLFGKQSYNLVDSKIDNNLKTKSLPTPVGLFFPSRIPFAINNSSLRILYDELKEIPVKKFPNATHDLLRSFLECSLVFYLKEVSEYDKIKKNSSHNPKLGEMLTHIINGSCKNINDHNLIATLRQIKSDFDQPYSLERMHMINHNEHFTSKERDVRATWAQLESLFKIILNSVE